MVSLVVAFRLSCTWNARILLQDMLCDHLLAKIREILPDVNATEVSSALMRQHRIPNIFKLLESPELLRAEVQCTSRQIRCMNLTENPQQRKEWEVTIIYFLDALLPDGCFYFSIIQESPPAWTQEAYRLPCSKSWGGGTYLGRAGGYPPWPGGVPTLAGGYLPWPGGTPPCPVGTHLGWDGVPPQVWTDWKHYIPPSFGCGRQQAE